MQLAVGCGLYRASQGTQCVRSSIVPIIAKIIIFVHCSCVEGERQTVGQVCGQAGDHGAPAR